MRENIYVEELVINAAISQSAENPRVYSIEFDGSYDPLDPLRDVNYRVKATHESGESFDFYHESGVATLELPRSGKWNVEVFGIDTPYEVESGYYLQTIEVENFAPVANVYYSEGLVWNSVSMNASGTYDPDGYIISYNYKFIHEGGAVQTFITSNLIETFTLSSLVGKWNYVLKVVDNEGGESSVASGEFELTEPNEIPVAIFEEMETLDPYVVNLVSSSYDPDGAIESVEIVGTNDSGESINKNFTSPPYSLTLTPGVWGLRVVVIDNKGESSLPVHLSTEVRPIRLAFEVKPGSSPYAFVLDASDTVKKGDVWLNVSVYLNGGQVYAQQHQELIKEINVFNRNGDYEIIVSATDGIYTTPSLSKTVTQSMPAEDGDIIPEDPGELADATFLGVDSDNDGVRDDIELWVNAKSGLSSEQKAALKEMSKIMQEHIALENDKEASVDARYKEIAYDYCVEHRFGREPAWQILSEMRVEFYNTRERLLAWARGEVNFAGQAVVLDTNEEGYEHYCN